MTLDDDSKVFEHQPGVLTHKILEKVGEAPVTEISMIKASLETEVLNETIASFSQLNIPETGLHKLWFDEINPPLKERLSETVLD